MPPIAQPPLPAFEVRLVAPDISRWVPGNTGIAGFTTRESDNPGPHVALLAIAHGNEIAGAIVLLLTGTIHRGFRRAPAGSWFLGAFILWAGKQNVPQGLKPDSFVVL